MSRRDRSSFKEIDVTRAIRATEKAGKSVRRVTVRPDCIELDTGEDTTKRVNFFDEKLGTNGEHSDPEPAPLQKPAR